MLCVPAAVGGFGALAQPRAPSSAARTAASTRRSRKEGSTKSSSGGLLVSHRPADWPLVLAVDASTFERCDAETSPERGFYHSASKHSAGQPIVAGWSYQWISQLSFDPDSWTAPVDLGTRIPPSEGRDDRHRQPGKALRPACTKRRPRGPDVRLRRRLRPDRHLRRALRRRHVVLVRLRSDRVFYGDPIRRRRPGRGRPSRHGRRFKLSEEKGAPRGPDHEFASPTRATEGFGCGPGATCTRNSTGAGVGRGRSSRRSCAAPSSGSSRASPKPSFRPTRHCGCGGRGPESPTSNGARASLRRFDIEHTFRFVRGTLGWTTLPLWTPAQADRWTSLVVAAYTQLRLARGLVADLSSPGSAMSTRRAHPAAGYGEDFDECVQLSAPPPGHRNPDSRSWPAKGTRKPPRTRYPVVKKAA